MDVLQEYWGLIFAAIAGAMGYGELKSKTNATAKGLADLEKRLINQRREDMEIHKRDRMENRQVLDEMRADIKSLLQRYPK